MAGRPVSARTKAYARSWVLSHHNIEIEVTRQLVSGLDEDTGLIRVSHDGTGYVGSARFWLSDDGRSVMVGEGDFTTVSTYISLPWDASPVPELDEYVIVTSAYDDPALVDKVFRIVGVDGGGFMRAARRLAVTAVTENRDTR